MRTRLTIQPEHSSRQPSQHLDALMADLGVLDAQLARAVQRLRLTQPESEDPAHRGLVIGESDVDAWLTDLSATGETGTGVGAAVGQDAGGVGPLGLMGEEGGRLRLLGDMFGLGLFERAIVLTALAPEVDLAYGNLYSYVHDDVTRKHATLDLVMTLWGDSTADRLEARRMLDAGSPLCRYLLLNVDDSPHNIVPMLGRPLLLDPRITSYLLGSDDPDHELAGSARVVVPISMPNGRGPESLPNSDHAAPPQMEKGQMRSLAQLAKSAMLISAPVPAPVGARHAPPLQPLPLRNPSTIGKNAPTPDSRLPTPNPQTPSTNGSSPPNKGITVWMRGPEKQAKKVVAEQLASMLGCPLLVIDAPLLIASNGDARKYLYRALREAQLQGALLFWADADILMLRRDDLGLDFPSLLAHMLVEWPGCSLFDTRTAYPLRIAAGPLSVELNFPAPSNEARRALWERALGDVSLAPDVDLPLLTGAFRLTGEQIEAAADTARQAAIWRAASSGDPDDLQITMRDLLMACRSHSNRGLGMLSKKVVPRYTWNDLVLPGDRVSQLHEMTHHVRYGPVVFEQWGFDRKLSGGKGLNVLFAGSPGTGKTMAAEVLATDLGLELYKIDLSSIVSKYIGETEKNLEKIFNEGSTSNAILFFDEADSLFGKRSQVKDSHDRYANIEISYLLQRMEEYDGIVILATNLRKNLDDAFIRRLHGAIEFPMPEEPDRLEIWRRTFPIEAPLDPTADLAYLATKFKLSGGNIKNIVLEAAFFAAEAGTDIIMTHLVRATRREHQKMGKLITASDFGQYASLLAKDDIIS